MKHNKTKKINKTNENQLKSVRADGNDPRGDLLFKKRIHKLS